MEDDEPREEWTRSEIMKLIELYKAQDCLWNVNNLNYRDKRKRHAAWKYIATALGHDLMSVERKMKVLKTQFMHCYKLFKKYSSNGEIYQPKWFAYKSLKFLIPGKIIRENREISRMNEEGLRVIKSEQVITAPELQYPQRPDAFEESQDLPIAQNSEQRSSDENTFRTLMKQLNTSQQTISTPRQESYRPILQREPEIVDATTRDEFAIFGELIACRLRKIKNVRTRLTVQFNITNLVFEAEMQEVEQENVIDGYEDNKRNIM